MFNRLGISEGLKLHQDFYVTDLSNLYLYQSVETTRMYTLSVIGLSICLVYISIIMQGTEADKCTDCTTTASTAITDAGSDIDKVCSAVKTNLDCLAENCEAGASNATIIDTAKKLLSTHGCGTEADKCTDCTTTASTAITDAGSDIDKVCRLGISEGLKLHQDFYVTDLSNLYLYQSVETTRMYTLSVIGLSICLVYISIIMQGTEADKCTDCTTTSFTAITDAGSDIDKQYRCRKYSCQPCCHWFRTYILYACLDAAFLIHPYEQT
ncbi:unnamed protein product [Mytilus coruscus]|uniref:Uncharacterized protein n=1 Tax=Mytilus coruscus TaxID=42192 RepID=A0A6J7ZUI6_MYTCO|nr:unnamed protein product [Mytilus coruscus]